jgi:hypothetical protein
MEIQTANARQSNRSHSWMRQLWRRIVIAIAGA